MATRAGSNNISDLEEAEILDSKDQFLFFQNSTKKTKRITKANMAISGGGIRGRFVDSATGNDVGYTSATALANAATAQATANGAQTAANGRNRIFYQSTAPTSPVDGYALIDGDLWFNNSSEENYAMYTWNESLPGANKWEVREIADLSIARINVGKLTSGFISSKVIELSDSTAYFQSSTFIETWVSGKTYKTTKTIPSDVIKVKVLQTDGSYKVYNCNEQHVSSGASFPGPDAGKWTEVSPVPKISVDIGDGNVDIPDFGFRIVGNGQAEFGGGLFRGAVIAEQGFFGTTKNAVKIDSDGMQIGSTGRIKSSLVSWSGTGAGVFAGKGFFLGYTGGEYQFYIGDYDNTDDSTRSLSKYLRWNGQNLIVNGELIGNSSGGAGLTISSGFGIRYVNKTSVLTITGGNENGVQGGAQIDFVGIDSEGPVGNAAGQLALSAGYKKATGSNAEASGFTDPFDGSIVFRTGYGSDLNSGANLIGVRRLIIERNGTVTVGSQSDAVKAGSPNSGSGKLIVETSVEAPMYTSTSSKRFKKKIKNLKNGLKKISQLRPVVFDWKTKDLKNDIGLIAEEVNEVIPNLVGFNNKGEVVGIDYGKLTPILIQAVKELSLEVERLKNKIK